MLAALLRQRRRLALATVAIALGVGYLAGALTLLDRVSQGLQNLASSGTGGVDLVIEGTVAYESTVEQVRRLVPDSIVDSVRPIDGVASATPRIEDIAVILRPDGTPVVAPGLSEQPIGANWPTGATGTGYRLITGTPPSSSTDVVIDERSAQSANVSIGDELSIAGKSRVGTYRVSGIVANGSGDLPPGSSIALLSTSEARSLFDRPDDDNWIGITLEPGADAADVSAEIASQLPSGVEVVDAATAAQHRQEGLNRSFSLVRSLLIGFAGLALLVGMVTVANSLALLYAERRRTFASLRLVGAKPRQLLGASLIEATLLALVASLIGAPLGLLIGRAIEAALSGLGSPIPVAGPLLSWRALGWAVLIGTVATVVAALLPAWRACKVSPIEAVNDASAAPTKPIGNTIATAAVAGVIAGGAVALLLIQGRPTPTALLAGLAAGVVVFLIGLMPLALAAVVSGGVRILPVPPVALRRIAARDVRRSRTRTAATTGALAVATAVVVALAVFLSSFVASLEGEVTRTVGADLVVDSGTFTRGGLPAELLADLSNLPDVAASSGWQVGRATVETTPVRMTGLDRDAALEVIAYDWVGTAPTELRDDQILLAAPTAISLGASVGDAIPVQFTSGGVEQLEIAGIYQGGGVLLGEMVLDRSTLLREVPATPDIAALVTLDPDTPAARESVTELAATYGVTSVLEPGQFVDRRSDLLRGFQRVIQWMLIFTLLQALIGVVNTLLLSVGERRREFGLLRATGATRRQLHRMVLLEGLALAVVGTVLGVVLGIGLSRLSLVPLASLGLRTFTIPVVTVAVVAVIAVLVGVLSAMLPARWASRVPALVAVSDVGYVELRARRTRRGRRAEPTPATAPMPTVVTAGPAGSFDLAGEAHSGFHFEPAAPAAGVAAVGVGAAGVAVAGVAADSPAAPTPMPSPVPSPVPPMFTPPPVPPTLTPPPMPVFLPPPAATFPAAATFAPQPAVQPPGAPLEPAPIVADASVVQEATVAESAVVEPAVVENAVAETAVVETVEAAAPVRPAGGPLFGAAPVSVPPAAPPAASPAAPLPEEPPAVPLFSPVEAPPAPPPAAPAASDPVPAGLPMFGAARAEFEAQRATVSAPFPVPAPAPEPVVETTVPSDGASPLFGGAPLTQPTVDVPVQTAGGAAAVVAAAESTEPVVPLFESRPDSVPAALADPAELADAEAPVRPVVPLFVADAAPAAPAAAPGAPASTPFAPASTPVDESVVPTPPLPVAPIPAPIPAPVPAPMPAPMPIPAPVESVPFAPLAEPVEVEPVEVEPVLAEA
jgi:putative ABC transport system permease protein